MARSRGFAAKLWVSSAGYGLFPSETAICPYSATFAAGENDSVWRASDGGRLPALRTWWRGLQALPGPGGKAPRSLAELATLDPGAALLVVASPAYVAAMADDLALALNRLSDPQQMIVVSSREPSLPDWLAPHLVPSEARLQPVLGGSLVSLHARTARRMLEEVGTLPFRADALVQYFLRLLSEVDRAPAPTRQRMGDEGLRAFILSSLAAEPTLACTAALRRLRDSGQACEQKRFAGLFGEIRRTLDAA